MIEIPLFPLSGVLLPGGKVPLQIFEQRYMDLVRESMKSGEPFGIVWIRRGAEVAERGRASPELGDWGTFARIVDWDRKLTMNRRFQVLRVDDGVTLLRGAMRFACVELSSGRPRRLPQAFIDGYGPAVLGLDGTH